MAMITRSTVTTVDTRRTMELEEATMTVVEMAETGITEMDRCGFLVDGRPAAGYGWDHVTHEGRIYQWYPYAGCWLSISEVR